MTIILVCYDKCNKPVAILRGIMSIMWFISNKNIYLNYKLYYNDAIIIILYCI